MAGMTSRAMLAQNATTLTQKQTHNTSTPNPAAGAPKCKIAGSEVRPGQAGELAAWLARRASSVP
jgi:hypothetical protein